MRTPRARLGAALLLATFMVPAGSPAADRAIPSHEFSGAMRETNWVRVLAERLSLQNLLYQLKLGGVTKDDLERTSEEMDRVLHDLRKGSPARWVPAPPTPKIAARIDVIDGRWGPLQTMALASPYDYQRRAAVERASRIGDPLLVRHFDALARELGDEAERLLQLYLAECRTYEYPLCEAQALNGMPALWSERMLNAYVQVRANDGGEDAMKRLRESRDAVDAVLARIAEVSLVREAMDPSRGGPAQFIAGVFEDTNQVWVRLRGNVDLVLDGQEDESDLASALGDQKEFIALMARLRIAMEQYAAPRREVSMR